MGVANSFPTLRKTSELGSSLPPTGFPPSQQVLFSNKNIEIKPDKAKHFVKKDFIFSQIVVNQLYSQSIGGSVFSRKIKQGKNWLVG
ncbi:MAG: hypothetical protein IIB56_15225 [Planctomycetes bacterium]|nr:hypothetical protein [Planctomycetota bacterium]